jgi:hypothetical protein
MSHHALLQLSGSKGIGRFVLFKGLKYAVLVKPTVYGNAALESYTVTANSLPRFKRSRAHAYIRI